MSLTTQQVPLGALGSDLAGIKTLVHVVTIDHAKVLRGPNQPTSTVMLDAASAPEHIVDKRVIMCGYWRPADQLYIVRSPDAIFVEVGDGWARSYGRDVVADDKLRATVASTNVDAVTLAAKLVAVGTVTSFERTVVTFGDGERSKAWQLILEVRSIAKGQYHGEELPITILRGDYPAPWRGETPVTFNPGEEWIAFLGETDGLYYPVLGANGLLMMSADRVFYDRTAPYSLSKRDLMARVKEMSSEE